MSHSALHCLRASVTVVLWNVRFLHKALKIKGFLFQWHIAPTYINILTVCFAWGVWHCQGGVSHYWQPRLLIIVYCANCGNHFPGVDDWSFNLYFMRPFLYTKQGTATGWMRKALRFVVCTNKLQMMMAFLWWETDGEGKQEEES